MVRIPGFHYCGLVHFLVGELRSRELHHPAKKNKILNKGSILDACPGILIILLFLTEKPEKQAQRQKNEHLNNAKFSLENDSLQKQKF